MTRNEMIFSWRLFHTDPTTRMIAAGAAGNVRAAMADLEMWMG